MKLLSYNLLEVSEMSEQIAKVCSVVYVEPFPKVATHHHATKAQLLGHPHIVDVDAA